MNALKEIREVLKNKSDSKTKKSWKKFIHPRTELYGVKIATLNNLVSKYKKYGLELAKPLWRSDRWEEQILAAKMLAPASKENPIATLLLAKKFIQELSDWATCDTLATQGIRRLIKSKPKESLRLINNSLTSKNPWMRRFGIVALTNYANDKNYGRWIKETIAKFEDDREYCVRKAVEWLKRKSC